MDDIVWFPVSDQEKKALERLCKLHGITPKEWFNQALYELEQGVIPLMQSIPAQGPGDVEDKNKSTGKSHENKVKYIKNKIKIENKTGDKIESEHKNELGEAAR